MQQPSDRYNLQNLIITSINFGLNKIITLMRSNGASSVYCHFDTNKDVHNRITFFTGAWKTFPKSRQIVAAYVRLWGRLCKKFWNITLFQHSMPQNAVVFLLMYRLALEKKALFKHLKTLLNDRDILRYIKNWIYVERFKLIELFRVFQVRSSFLVCFTGSTTRIMRLFVPKKKENSSWFTCYH